MPVGQNKTPFPPPPPSLLKLFPMFLHFPLTLPFTCFLDPISPYKKCIPLPLLCLGPCRGFKIEYFSPDFDIVFENLLRLLSIYPSVPFLGSRSFFFFKSLARPFGFGSLSLVSFYPLIALLFPILTHLRLLSYNIVLSDVTGLMVLVDRYFIADTRSRCYCVAGMVAGVGRRGWGRRRGERRVR